MSKLIFLVLILVSTSIYSATEKELRFPISTRGFRDLLKKDYAKKKVRTDYYFDLYTESGYLLKSLEQPLKFRLKIKKRHQYEMAVSKLINTELFPNDQVMRTIKETETIKFEISQALGKQLVRLSEELFLHLRYRNFNQIDEKVSDLNNHLKKIITDHQLTDLIPYLEQTFVVANKSRKERYSRKLVIDGVTYKTKIGRTIEKNSSGLNLGRYEWEAEPKGTNQIPSDIFESIWELLDLHQKPARFFSRSRSTTGVYYHRLWKSYFDRIRI